MGDICNSLFKYLYNWQCLREIYFFYSNSPAFLLPKTPCLKRRKIEPENDWEEEDVIEPARKPRKLKRNSILNKNRVSKIRKSTRRSSTRASMTRASMTRASTQPRKASIRVTRAIVKKKNPDESVLLQPTALKARYIFDKLCKDGVVVRSLNTCSQG